MWDLGSQERLDPEETQVPVAECIKNEDMRKRMKFQLSQHGERRKQQEICFQASLDQAVFTAENVNKETWSSAHSKGTTACFCYTD